MLCSDIRHVYMHTRNTVTQRYQVAQEISVHMRCGNLGAINCVYMQQVGNQIPPLPQPFCGTIDYLFEVSFQWRSHNIFSE